MATAIFGFNVLPSWQTLALTVLVSKASFALYSLFAEKRADNFASADATSEELKTVRKLFKAQINHNIKCRVNENSLLSKIVISNEGELRLNYTHPSLAERIKKVEDTLLRRGEEFDENPDVTEIENTFEKVLQEFYKNK